MATRQQKNESRKYNLVRLHLEDLETIEQTLLSLDPPVGSTPGGFPKIEVSNGEWETNSVQELVQKGDLGPFTGFKIVRSGAGLIQVEVQRYQTRLYVSDLNDLPLRGAYDSIDKTLKGARRGRLLRFLAHPTVSASVSVLSAVFALAGLVAALNSESVQRVVPLCAAGFLFGGVGMVAAWTTVKRNGLVFLERRAARPNFFARNQDQLLLMLISAVLGAVIGAVVTLVVKA